MSGPRYSIIPGDFARDVRADVGHFRVLNLIGTHTDRAGWCRLKQLGIGQEVGLSRKTVNGKIKDLVTWGYVEKHAENGSGRAIWYRTIMDRKVLPETEDGDEIDADDAEIGCETSEEPVTPPLQVEETCNPIEVTPGVTTGRNTERPFLNDPSPLTPHAGGQSVKQDWKEGALARLRASGKHIDAIVAFVEPLLASDKRFSLGKDPVPALAEIAEAAHGIAKPALGAAVKRLVEHASKLTVRSIRAELDAARSHGARIVIRKGTPQWSRWLEYSRQSQPQQARAMERFDTWEVPSEWPPAAKSGRSA